MVSAERGVHGRRSQRHSRRHLAGRGGTGLSFSGVCTQGEAGSLSGRSVPTGQGDVPVLAGPLLEASWEMPGWGPRAERVPLAVPPATPQGPVISR